MINKIENYLKNSTVNKGSPYMESVYDSMRYSLLAGGKRIRPLLTMMFAKLCGGSDDMALPFGCAIEMVHTYSLIHDDLPCMDNDELRRGRPTNHIVHGESGALLAGDALLTLAFETCLSEDSVKLVGFEKASKSALILAKYAGCAGMVGGQSIDLKTEGKDVGLAELEDMVVGKTVALLKASCVIGAIVAGATDEEIKSAETYAHSLGMAFQIQDDILDVKGDAKLLGKNIGMDEQNNKRNFVSILGIEEAERLVEEYTEKAIEALSTFKGDSYDLENLAIKLSVRNK